MVAIRTGVRAGPRGRREPGPPSREGAAPAGRAPGHPGPASTVPVEPRRPRLDQAWKVRLAQAAIVGAVVVGAVTGPLALVAGVRPAPAEIQDRLAATPSVGPEGFAQLYVRSYFNQADESRPETLAAFYPEAGDALDGMRAGRFYVAQTATLGATPVGDGYWSVLVAAELLELTGSGAQPAGTSYYLVSVYGRDGRYVATALPAQVPTPRSSASPKLAHGELNPPAGEDPVAAAVQRFFEALLVGQGELSRYVDPESGIRAITPPPFASVTLRRISQPGPGAGPVTVMTEVAGVNAAGHTAVLHYSLELEQDDARWEVRGLLVAPQLAPVAG